MSLPSHLQTMRRVVIEHPVTTTPPAMPSAVAAALKASRAVIRPTRNDGHLTVLHLGRFADLHRDMQTAHASPLHAAQLRGSLFGLLRRVTSRFTGFSVRVSRLQVLAGEGEHRPVVIPVAYPVELLDMREQMWDEVSGWFTQHIDVDLVPFIANSRDLRYGSPDRWTPHVTVAWCPRDRMDAFPVPFDLDLSFGPAEMFT